MITISDAYKICKKKFEIHIENFNELCEFWGCKNGDYYTESLRKDLYFYSNWMASFITGLAPMFYKSSKDDKYLKWANKYACDYHNKVFNYSMETMHDLGFLYSPYSVAMYKITGSTEHKTTALKAADVLLKRFNIKGQYLDAWERMDCERKTGRAIIDSMINIQLLFWAWKETGHIVYKDVAKAHADTTIKYFVRDDYSVCHSIEFDWNTGEFIREYNGCGYSDGSHWARGTTWMVYGLAMTAKYLNDASYYELAEKIADKYIECCGNKYIPVWDFKLPEDMPASECSHKDNPEWDVTDAANCKYNIDTSAAAIFANALLIMDEFKENKKYKDFAAKSVEVLCNEYLDTNEKTPGILKAQNGQMLYTTYGDYFFVEALQRILFDVEICW